VPNLAEVAHLVINDRIFKDWQSVMVRQPWKEPFYEFQFSCSEGSPIPKAWAEQQIKPGDRCTIFLAGQLALTGWVNVRQVAYSAEQHGVIIQGRGLPQDAHDSSVVHPTGQFKGSSWQAIASAVLKPFQLSLVILGQIPSEPFKDAQVHPHETAWEFIERLARMRGITLSSNAEGAVIAAGGQGGGASGSALVEGVNILEAREIINDLYSHNPYLFRAQMNGDDKKWGPDVTHVPWTVLANQLIKRYRPLIGFSEMPGLKPDLTKRVGMEAGFRQGASVWVQIIVQGWLRDGGKLWTPGDGPGNAVHVTSPMLIIDEDLYIKVATFTQDDKMGTRTTLDLVRHYDLVGVPDLSGQGAGPAP
jgi:prophage tail gpP-like protein